MDQFRSATHETQLSTGAFRTVWNLTGYYQTAVILSPTWKNWCSGRRRRTRGKRRRKHLWRTHSTVGHSRQFYASFRIVFPPENNRQTSRHHITSVLQMCKLREVNLACPNSEMAVQCQSWDFESIWLKTYYLGRHCWCPSNSAHSFYKIRKQQRYLKIK